MNLVRAGFNEGVDSTLVRHVLVREREKETKQGREKQKSITPFQPHRADAGAVRIFPGTS